MFMQIIWSLLLVVGYTPTVVVTYYALTDEECLEAFGVGPFPKTLWIAAVLWPLTWALIMLACILTFLCTGIERIHQAVAEARERRRPWRRKGNVVILDARGVQQRRENRGER